MSQDKSGAHYRDRFDEAIRLRDSGDISTSEMVLASLVGDHPERHASMIVLGGLYLSKSDYSSALRCFAKAAGLAPRSELASLGLFHCLWGLGRRQDALEEAKRFVETAGCSEEYAIALEDLKNPETSNE